MNIQIASSHCFFGDFGCKDQRFDLGTLWRSIWRILRPKSNNIESRGLINGGKRSNRCLCTGENDFWWYFLIFWARLFWGLNSREVRNYNMFFSDSWILALKIAEIFPFSIWTITVNFTRMLWCIIVHCDSYALLYFHGEIVCIHYKKMCSKIAMLLTQQLKYWCQ